MTMQGEKEGMEHEVGNNKRNRNYTDARINKDEKSATKKHQGETDSDEEYRFNTASSQPP